MGSSASISHQPPSFYPDFRHPCLQFTMGISYVHFLCFFTALMCPSQLISSNNQVLGRNASQKDITLIWGLLFCVPVENLQEFDTGSIRSINTVKRILIILKKQILDNWSCRRSHTRFRELPCLSVACLGESVFFSWRIIQPWPMACSAEKDPWFKIN